MSESLEDLLLDCEITLVSTSPTQLSNTDSTDDTEVFFGPVKHEERIAAYKAQSTIDDESESHTLNDRQWAEIHKEANKLVKRLYKDVPVDTSDGQLALKPCENVIHRATALSAKKSLRNIAQISKNDQENRLLDLGSENVDTVSKFLSEYDKKRSDSQTDCSLKTEESANCVKDSTDDYNVDVLEDFFKGKSTVEDVTENKIAVNNRTTKESDTKNSAGVETTSSVKEVQNGSQENRTDCINNEIGLKKDAIPTTEGQSESDESTTDQSEEHSVIKNDEPVTVKKSDNQKERESSDVKLETSADPTKSQEKKEATEESARKETTENSNKAKPKPTGLSRLRPPSFRSKDRNKVPALQKFQKPETNQPTKVEQQPTQSKPTKVQQQAQQKDQLLPPSSQVQAVESKQKGLPRKSPMDQNQTAPKSRLSIPKFGVMKKPTSNEPVKPSAVKTTGVTSTSKFAPPTKLQMLKPSGLHRPGTANKQGGSVKKSEPMKAFKPSTTTAEQASSYITPAKMDKTVKRTKLAASFMSPKPSPGITGGRVSPVTSSKKRKSSIPTPSKGRGSASSPGSSVGGSPPLLTRSANKRRASSVNKYGEKNGGAGNVFNDLSPSSMMPKKPLVVNTPNLPKEKKISPWSPIQKRRPIDMLDEFTRCTKKQK